MPSPAAWCRNPARIECLGDGAEGRGARLLDFGDDRQDVAGRAIGFSLDRRDRLATRRLDMRIAELDPLRPRRTERRLGPARDQGALLFGQRGIEVQDEGIDVRPQFSDDEGHTMRHQTGNEMHVAREAIELGDHDRASHRPRFGERRRQLRPAVERVASLASFDLDEFGHDIETHFLREPGQRFPLRFDAETGATLARCADPDVSDNRFHERLESLCKNYTLVLILYKPFSRANWIKSRAWFARRG